ncbi:MAG: ribonuclease PH [Limisphaerales bacterium]|jgi:ribonuclease PH|nr:ribonuclease PH [Verrucomicrobiota bacterium]
MSDSTLRRPDGRLAGELRPISFVKNIAPYALGSVLIRWGNTQVICAVSCEESVPRWMKEQGVQGGWATAEYSMLPYSTLGRKPRDITRGRLDGRSQEIQRLIGRSIRSVLNREALGARTLYVDCDVVQADGGTRAASITGAFVALKMAVRKLLDEERIWEDPIQKSVAAVSVGILKGRALLDLDYQEDSAAEVDMNIVMTSSGEFCELQGTGEQVTFSEKELQEMLELGRRGIYRLNELQEVAFLEGEKGD